MPGDEHTALRRVMLVQGTVDVVVGLLFFVYPAIVEVLAPQLSYNSISERIIGAILVATGVGNYYAYSYRERQRFVDLLIPRALGTSLVVIGFLITMVQKPADIVTLWPMLFFGGFVADSAIYLAFLVLYTSKAV